MQYENILPNTTDRYYTYLYSVSEFENQCSGNNLIMFNQNIRSSNRNFDCLFAFINNIEKSVYVIVMSETWFSVTSKCSIEGYNSFHSYRDNRTGGGVSIFIRKSLRSYCISEKNYYMRRQLR